MAGPACGATHRHCDKQEAPFTTGPTHPAVDVATALLLSRPLLLFLLPVLFLLQQQLLLLLLQRLMLLLLPVLLLLAVAPAATPVAAVAESATSVTANTSLLLLKELGIFSHRYFLYFLVFKTIDFCAGFSLVPDIFDFFKEITLKSNLSVKISQ